MWQVKNYVLEKLILERPLEETGPESNASAGQPGNQQAGGNGNGKGPTGSRSASRGWPQGTKPVVEILCNDQVNISTFGNSPSDYLDRVWLIVVE